jgi:hypothetical protein
MDELEERLRGLFADDRLAVTPRPDAMDVVRSGVRRRRHSVVIATLAAVVLIAGGGLGVGLSLSGNSNDTPHPAPPVGQTPTPKMEQPTPTPAVVEWSDAAYDYHHPPVFPGAVADPTVPWCNASQLSMTAFFQGATGNWVGTVNVVNRSARTCAVQGQPAVRMLHVTPAGAVNLVHSIPEPFYVDAWVPVAPGAQAIARIDWEQEFCHEPDPNTISIDLPHSGGTLTTSMHGAPRCNDQNDPPSAGRLDVNGFLSEQENAGTPFTPLAALDANIDQVTNSVAAGAVLHYQLQLSTNENELPLDPCLPYRVRLYAQRTGYPYETGHIYEEDHLLNCAGVTVRDSQQPTDFDMQIATPRDLPPGDYALVWQSVLQQVNAIAGGDVHVTAPPPQCQQNQLTTTFGRGGAAAGSYYATIIFTNTSATACSLYGYPGVQYTDSDGRPAPTKAQHDPQITPTLVVLAPRGGQASTRVGMADFKPPAGASPCDPSKGLLVIAPGLTEQVLVPRGTPGRCTDSLFVTAVRPGAG